MKAEDWQEMDSAPKNGTEILVCRDTGCGFESTVVWWSATDKVYPWHSYYNAYTELVFDYWMPIVYPEYPEDF